MPILPTGLRERLSRITGLQITTLMIAVVVATTVALAFGRLALTSWQTYGAGIPDFYREEVFGSPQVRQALINTAIIATVSTLIAVFIGTILAWLNERTDASIGPIGRVLPLVPFLMPAIALPLGWVFLGAPNAGVLNVLLRSMLRAVGINLQSGPLDVFSWWGLIFLYSVVLTGFAYLMLTSPVRDLDSRLEDAARMAGAGPLRLLFRVVLPVLRPAMVNAFFLSMMIALVMVSVPLTIAHSADIPVTSVLVVQLISGRPRPLYADAFLIGLMLLIPILLLWVIQNRYSRGLATTTIGAKAMTPTRLRLGRWQRVIGRSFFVGYVVIAVGLPFLGLIYLSGLGFWSGKWPTSWNPLPHLVEALTDSRTAPAIFWSVFLGVIAGAALIVITYVMSYGQRLFPRLGSVVDVVAKIPAVVTQILTAVALLLLFGGAPFHLVATAWILLIGYFVVFLPFASVVTTGAVHEIGTDVLEAAYLSGASEFRTFRKIATPLAWPTLVAGFLLMLVFISGDVNISLMLATTSRPVVGQMMVDLFQFGTMPRVASFALVMTVLNLILIGLFIRLLNVGRARTD